VGLTEVTGLTIVSGHYLARRDQRKILYNRKEIELLRFPSRKKAQVSPVDNSTHENRQPNRKAKRAKQIETPSGAKYHLNPTQKSGQRTSPGAKGHFPHDLTHGPRDQMLRLNAKDKRGSELSRVQRGRSERSRV